jgi:hypothetical protein
MYNRPSKLLLLFRFSHSNYLFTFHSSSRDKRSADIILSALMAIIANSVNNKSINSVIIFQFLLLPLLPPVILRCSPTT